MKIKSFVFPTLLMLILCFITGFTYEAEETTCTMQVSIISLGNCSNISVVAKDPKTQANYPLNHDGNCNFSGFVPCTVVYDVYACGPDSHGLTTIEMKTDGTQEGDNSIEMQGGQCSINN